MNPCGRAGFRPTPERPKKKGGNSGRRAVSPWMVGLSRPEWPANRQAETTIPVVPSSPGAPAAGDRVDARAGHVADLALVRRILDGDEEAWRYFVERYAGLILAMSRRYLHTHDVDDIRTVFADVLDSLHRSRLRTYEGRAALSTWLAL